MYIGGQKDNKKVLTGHVIVGTPGKIFNAIRYAKVNKPSIDFSKVKFFVADEADDLMSLDKNNSRGS